MAFLTCGVMAQSETSDSSNAKTKPLVVKTSSVVSSSYRTFVATAYSLRGRMANGQHVHQGAIATDPRVLPIGTVVHIEGLGNFVVKDTGGAIKGFRIDIWMSSRASAIKWGKRPVKLRVVSMPKKYKK